MRTATAAIRYDDDELPHDERRNDRHGVVTRQLELLCEVLRVVRHVAGAPGGRDPST